MQAGIARNARRTFLAVVAAIAMVLSVVFLFASPADADHGSNVCPETDGWSQHQGSDLTDVWGSATIDGSFVVFDVNAGWTVEVCVKGGSPHPTMTTIVGPVEDEAVRTPEHPGPGQHPGVSHWGFRATGSSTTSSSTTSSSTSTSTTEPTTTTSEPEETTTTTEPEETTTTVDVGETTVATQPEETTATTIEDEVLGEEVTTTQPGETTTTVVDEVLAEELPFTGIDTGGLAILAAALASLGLLVTLSARRIED